MGILPQTMLNYLALLGWNPGDEQEYFTHEELAEAFTLERVQKGGAIFSMVKLSAMNKHYLSELSDDGLLAWAKTHYDIHNIAITNPQKLLGALKTELGRFASYDIDGTALHEAMSWYSEDWPGSYDPNILIWKKSTQEATRGILAELIGILEPLSDERFTKAALEEFLIEWIDSHQKGRGDVLWPLRVALTGREHSPAPFDVAAVIGKQDTLKRIQNAHDSLA